MKIKNKEINAKTSKIIKLEKENENLKEVTKFNALKEEVKWSSENFIDVYHYKTLMILF